MKKIIAITVSVLIVISMCIALVACSPSGSGGNSSSVSVSYAGTYKLEAIIVKSSDESKTLEVGADFNGTALAEDDVVLTINKNNTWTVVMGLYYSPSETINGTWEKKDGKLYLTSEKNNQVVIAISDGSKLTLEAEEKAEGDILQKIILKRVSASNTTSGNNIASYIGVYEFESLTIKYGGGEPDVIKVGDTYDGFTYSKSSYFLMVNKDATWRLSAYAFGSMGGTWELKSGNLCLYVAGDDEPQVVTREGDKFAMEDYSGGVYQKIVFKKVDTSKNNNATLATSYAGTYKFALLMETDRFGYTSDYEVGKTYDGVSYTEDSYVLTIRMNNTWSITMRHIYYGDETVETISGTWEGAGGSLCLIITGDEDAFVIATLEDNYIVVQEHYRRGTSTLILRRV